VSKPALLFRAGMAVLALGGGPLLLYCLFGPRDGNPIGLGLLFAASFPVAMVLLAAGGLGKFLKKVREGSPEEPRDTMRAASRPGRRNDSRPGGHWP
jgi:hypothetical protein